jgi:DNA-directed RNA polymerase II subunit RPB3
MHIKSDSQDVKPAIWHSVINKDMEGNPDEIGVLIGKIREGQEIDVEMIARKGISKDHFKYCPVAVAKFQYEAQIEINQQYMNLATREQKASFVRSCPTKVYELTSTDEVVVTQHLKCIFCDECVRSTESWKMPIPPVKVGFKKFRFIFDVETNGALRPEDIVRHAFNELRAKLASVKESCETMRNPSYMMSNR